MFSLSGWKEKALLGGSKDRRKNISQMESFEQEKSKKWIVDIGS